MTLTELFAGYPLLLVGMTFVLGLLVGSFLNVVVYRVPLMLQRDWRAQCLEFLDLQPDPSASPDPTAAFATFNLMKPESHCPACKTPIKPWQNIPVVSWLMLGGKCHHCKTAISPRYPMVEFVSGVLAALVAWEFGFGWTTLALLILTWCLVALTLIDADHQLLPDDITLPLMWLGLLLASLGQGLVSLEDAVIGAMAGYLCLWLFYWSFKLLTGKEGMGYGDFKLLAALGGWLGWQSLLPIVILSSLVGAVYGITMMVLFRRDRSHPMPFGPYLAGAGYIMLVWGPALTEAYLRSVSP